MQIKRFFIQFIFSLIMVPRDFSILSLMSHYHDGSVSDYHKVLEGSWSKMNVAIIKNSSYVKIVLLIINDGHWTQMNSPVVN